MAGSILASLTTAGVIERAGRGRSILRLTHRFLAHVERTAAIGHSTGNDALEAALASWNDPTPGGAVHVVAGIFEEQGAAMVLGPNPAIAA